jgi:hypothetical protein
LPDAFAQGIEARGVRVGSHSLAMLDRGSPGRVSQACVLEFSFRPRKRQL